LKTAAARFLIPAEIVAHKEDVAKYAEQLEFCVRNGYSPKAFIERCQEEGLPITASGLHKELYQELVKLDKANKNGVWARIIKNAFAPLFIGQVDYVAGNPPWVNWESLPEEYRNTLKPLWQEYGLFTLSGSAGRLGGGKKDLSMLFTYAAADNYLANGGRLGFVITQTVFKTKGAGDGFRRFRFVRDNKTVVLKPIAVHDLSDMQVFEGATNRTAVLVFEKSAQDFCYPVPYFVWRGPSRISQEQELTDVRQLVKIVKHAAIPVDPGKASSPWLTAPKETMKGIRKLIGQSAYKAYEGVNTGGLNACFWIRVLETLKNGNLLVENLHDVGKIKVERTCAAVEPDLVFPLLRGRDISPWRAEPSAWIILAQDVEGGKGIPETQMKRRQPKTYAYLKTFEGNKEHPLRGTLRGRALFKKYFRPTDPFYSMYNVAAHTLAPWKVLWPEVGHTVRAAVCGPGKVESEKPALPDHTIVAVSCQSREEAHFVCALLNSAPAQMAASAYIVLHPSPHILENIAVPRYKPSDDTHGLLLELSQRCHTAVAEDHAEMIPGLEAQIDCVAAKLWGVSAGELKAIQESLREARSQREGRASFPDAVREEGAEYDAGEGDQEEG
jgi:hypothetical protein